jgi:hypothetical protein
MFGAIMPANGGKAILVEDAAFREAAEGEHIDAMALSELRERSADDRYREIARLPTVYARPACFDPRQALVAQDQPIAACGRRGTLRQQDLAIRATDP